MATVGAMRDIFGPGLGESQRAVLGHLKREGPATLSELADALGLSEPTLREHLDALTARGLVDATGRRSRGPGRPSRVYAITPEAERLFPNREGELLRELTAFLLREGHQDLLERFFEQRARRLDEAAEKRLQGLRGRRRLEETAAILREEGFMADVATAPGEAPRLRLCHCPIREVVAVSHLPCRSELAAVQRLLGRELQREAYMPDGDRTCTYVVGKAGPSGKIRGSE